jgi:prepilin-type N-terminal cleavage/methylation domain-containing protein
MRRQRSQYGFSLFELLIAMAVGAVVMAASVMLYQKSVQVSNIVTSRTELQTEMRGAMNQIARDLNQAGTGIPVGGIPIPSAAAGGINPKFACDGAACYISSGNTFTQGVLYKITPGNNIGVTTSEATDALVIAYMDPIAPAGDATSSATGLDWRAYPTTNITANGDTVVMPAGTTPVLNDPQKGLVVGDLLLFQNAKGSAIGTVTNFDAASRTINLRATGDPLKFNQPATPAVSGTLASLATSPVPPAPTPLYLPVVVSRIMMITYFVRRDPTDSHLSLMRQVNARTPTPVAEYIEDLQVSYDMLDDSVSPVAMVANVADATLGSPAVVKPNQVRKVNLRITARSPRLNANGDYDRMSIATSVGPRNLSFHDTYN